jgi:hypothetical protein
MQVSLTLLFCGLIRDLNSLISLYYSLFRFASDRSFPPLNVQLREEDYAFEVKI